MMEKQWKNRSSITHQALSCITLLLQRKDLQLWEEAEVVSDSKGQAKGQGLIEQVLQQSQQQANTLSHRRKL